MPCAVILTALSVEYEAVRQHLSDLQENQYPPDNICESGTFTNNNQTWYVSIVVTGMNNTTAGVETARVITHFKPDVVMFVGIAGGIKDVQLGDVVAANRAYNYEMGKDEADTFQTRPVSEKSSPRITRQAEAAVRRGEWLDRIVNLPVSVPRAIVAPIASGEKVLGSRKSKLFQLIRTRYNDAVAVEMEGYGFLNAAFAHFDSGLQAIVVRGISDLIEGKNAPDAMYGDETQRQAQAAAHASAFAFEVLASLSVKSGNYSQLKSAIQRASTGLLTWPSTLVTQDTIERPELKRLLEQIQTEESSSTIVLGPPGSGKSALMATLGNRLVEQNYTVLAIKAEELTSNIQSSEDLQAALGLALPPAEVVETIACREPIIVLIDQLDAISELLDRKSQRLTLLLRLIRELVDCKNVHVVATCREFEFRYGSQFSRLAGIEELTLELPTWEAIAPIFKNASHNPNGMGESMRELLRSPHHLNIFLEIAQPGDVFDSSQRLLDRLWQERVLQQPNFQQCRELLETLTKRMTDDESLWVPAALIDSNPDTWQTLERAGLLISNIEKGVIGFRHQTYYDHALARLFARDSQSLTDLVLDRNDGLFIRPILLSCLNYLRGTAEKQYEQQLTNLLQTHKTRIRPHIRALLLEFVGSQQEPIAVEVQLMLPLLNSATEGIKVLAVMLGSRGWFERLCDRPEFTQWLEKPADQAVYCTGLLNVAAGFAPEAVWELLGDYWLEYASYDALSIRVIRNTSEWTPERVELICQIVQRHELNWYGLIDLTERIAEELPDQGAKLIRAHLEFCLEQAIELSNTPPPELPAGASEEDYYVHQLMNSPHKPFENLLRGGFFQIEEFAEAYSQSFVEEIWPWFIGVIQRLVYDEEPVTIRYRHDHIGVFDLSWSSIVLSLHLAIVELAKQDKDALILFVEENVNSELLIVHRLLAHGLMEIASQEPSYVLNYLLADQRRFSLGGHVCGNKNTETEQLIKTVVHHLQGDEIQQLEEAIQNFSYWHPTDQDEAKFRRKCIIYNREHRLSLLTAFPSEYLHPELNRLKQAEERALPWVEERRKRGGVRGGTVGPRMTKEEMAKASNEELLNLFNVLSDEVLGTQRHRDLDDDFSRSGGSDEQSREFGELVKDNPDRFLELLPHFQPQRQEKYAAKGLVSLADVDFSSSQVIQIVQELEQRGFISEDFREEVARALGKVAEKHQGLPLEMLELLKSWLSEHIAPKLEHYRSKDQEKLSSIDPILFGMGPTI